MNARKSWDVGFDDKIGIQIKIESEAYWLKMLEKLYYSVRQK